MTGIMHLNRVPKTGSAHPFERLLRRCIRNAADREQGRDIPLEDEYYEMLSWAELRPRTRLVRISPIDENGKVRVSHKSLIVTLVEHTRRILNYDNEVMEHGDKFLEIYNAEDLHKLSGSFLYAPTKPPYIYNLVAVHRKKWHGGLATR